MWVLLLIAVYPLTVDYYRFEKGYTEVWYMIPVQQLLLPDEYASYDMVFKKYSYRFDIYCAEKKDSAYFEGIKGTQISPEQRDNFFIDHIPVLLYPGTFQYRLKIESGASVFLYNGQIIIKNDVAQLTCSDIVLGRRCTEDRFVYRDYMFTPTIIERFSHGDTLFSYVEIYDLVPDSLLYTTRYQIVDSSGKVVYERRTDNRKYDYMHVDTFSMPIDKLYGNDYKLVLHVLDPATSAGIKCERSFQVVSSQAITGLENPQLRKQEADRQFTTHSLKGSDTERGKYYLEYGSPDEIEIIAMSEWGRQLEVWHYYSESKDVLFCDVKDDNNPRFITTLKPGELTNVLELSFHDPERNKKWPWLEIITPVSIDRSETLEEKRSTIGKEED